MTKKLIERDKNVVWHPFSPVKGGYPMQALKSGKGAKLITEDGKTIIDGISSWWVNTLGHSHPEIAQALYDQALTLPHVIFANFTHEPAVALCEKIIELLPHQSKVFFSDNGSTSVEVALKIAIQYWKNKGAPQKKRIIAIEGAYHGDTFGAMAVGERGGFNIAFEPYLFDVDFVPFPEKGSEQACIDELKKQTNKGDVAAFIFEPLVQGAAGMRIYSPEVLDKLIEIAHGNDVLCIADEVFTGFYRTGKMFASDHLTRKPDLFCLSKGLTAGTMPLSLTTVSEKVFHEFNSEDKERAFYHGHSFTGNPLGCSVSNKSLEILLRDETLKKIETLCTLQTDFAHKIEGLPSVKGAKTLGTILSIELYTEEETGYFNSIREKIYTFFIDRGVLLRPLGNILYFIPPYLTEEKEIHEVHSSIFEFLNSQLFFNFKEKTL